MRADLATPACRSQVRAQSPLDAVGDGPAGMRHGRGGFSEDRGKGGNEVKEEEKDLIKLTRITMKDMREMKGEMRAIAGRNEEAVKKVNEQAASVKQDAPTTKLGVAARSRAACSPRRTPRTSFTMLFHLALRGRRPERHAPSPDLR